MSEHAGPDLTGKVALVTGGSRGLGEQMVFAFARAGADVVVTSRKLEACEEVARRVREETGRRAFAVASHVGRWSSMDELAEAVDREFGAIDVLVNNAGMSPLFDKLSDVPEALYDKVLDVNLKGTFRLSALVGQQMMERGGGSIINVSSYASLSPQPYFLPYAAAKAGLNALTVGFARAYAPTVRVNTLLAGPFRTDVAEHWPEDTAERHRRTYALQRAGEPDEVVGAALFLASDMSSYTTGSIVRVDGGPL
ncbi:SDR family NAD(P)-dependent oxidoreductase [Pseudonocardia oroxyli]|uniref:NAD(P)-dependent dehydrogenase, short-chain alcohol dehydrogenase family n=1 Tax=Pseudonocardia oroxyli TaxID=366584 RepID=A0A1G7TPK6_PSEOR|nr:SDR family oxidoreductase [Pseudonocardia oroxyli]SDG37052.1 NAD(P)-dependent dehydrogenase, short-chain alcohol dehydrogenase family [Pseudonocardia oroxyli]